jgi:hypothetical protein
MVAVPVAGDASRDDVSKIAMAASKIAIAAVRHFKFVIAHPGLSALQAVSNGVISPEAHEIARKHRTKKPKAAPAPS